MILVLAAAVAPLQGLWWLFAARPGSARIALTAISAVTPTAPLQLARAQIALELMRDYRCALLNKTSNEVDYLTPALACATDRLKPGTGLWPASCDRKTRTLPIKRASCTKDDMKPRARTCTLRVVSGAAGRLLRLSPRSRRAATSSISAASRSSTCSAQAAARCGASRSAAACAVERRARGGVAVLRTDPDRAAHGPAQSVVAFGR